MRPALLLFVCALLAQSYSAVAADPLDPQLLTYNLQTTVEAYQSAAGDVTEAEAC